MLDAKWLDFLKERFGTYAAIAGACATIIGNDIFKWYPIELYGWLRATIFIIGVGCAFLAVADIVRAMHQFVLWCWRPFERRRNKKRLRDEFRFALPTLNGSEIYCLAHLWQNNRKTFIGTQDCGAGSTLVSRGFIVMAARPGQVFTVLETPFTVPDEVWGVMEEERGTFDNVRINAANPFNRFTGYR